MTISPQLHGASPVPAFLTSCLGQQPLPGLPASGLGPLNCSSGKS
jgi:hypothetical protein